MQIDHVQFISPKAVAGFQVREVLTEADLITIQALRTQCFGQVPPFILQAMRRRDEVSQNILVVDQESSQVVGCCRMTCSTFSTDFDSDDSFDVSNLLATSKVSLELSYICVDKNQRRGPIIRALLAAVPEYCAAHDVDLIFGCASFPSTRPEEAMAIYNILMNPGHCVGANRRRLPPLLRFYELLGARVRAEPVFDPYFGCFDFLVALDIHETQDQIRRRFRRL